MTALHTGFALKAWGKSTAWRSAAETAGTARPLGAFDARPSAAAVAKAGLFVARVLKSAKIVLFGMTQCEVEREERIGFSKNVLPDPSLFIW